ncbi:unnamed protein product [Auanema sp. JU1783]|nr:unnamed protein product [Auanema sp. JU1783]
MSSDSSGDVGLKKIGQSLFTNQTNDNLSSNISNWSDIPNFVYDYEDIRLAMTSLCQFRGTTENYIVITVFIIIFLLSVIGNSLVILVILKQRQMRSITNIYLINLAFSDLMLSVICMPPTLVSMVMNCWLFGNTMCKLFAYLQPVVVSGSAYTLAVIAFERYFAICKPLHSRIWQTRSHAYAMITVVWAIAIIANVFLIFMYEERGYDTPNGTGITCTPIYPPMYHFAYQVYMTIVLCVVPLVVMITLYSTVIHQLKMGIKLEIAAVAENSDANENSVDDIVDAVHNSNNGMLAKLKKKIRSAQPNREKLSSARSTGAASVGSVPSALSHRRSETSVLENALRSTHNQKSAMAKQRVIKMLIVVVVIFFCCWTPSYIWWLLLMAGDSFEKLGLSVWNSDINTFITLLTYISSCTNPITYCFLNKKFRNAIYAMFGRKKVIRHHFQKVYIPVTSASPKILVKHPNINRSISTSSNLQLQQVASDSRLQAIRRTSSTSASHMTTFVIRRPAGVTHQPHSLPQDNNI